MAETPFGKRLFHKVWGGASAFLDRSRRIGWIDLLVVAGLGGILFGFITVAGEWTQGMRPEVEIDLSPAALPKYVLFSLSRGLFAYVLSLGFAVGYGYWAAKDRVAERILMPLLDILQSVPVLGFMPGLVLALVALFPSSNVGLELAAVVMIFTGQAWNMAFSVYHSFRAVPQDQQEAATVYRFTPAQRFRWVEMPFATMGLVWNSMMSMAGGWFFLMVSEAFSLGKGRDFRLPGIGSYMSVAAERKDFRAMAWAIAAMVGMIVALDQVLWRPLVVWAQKFRVEEGSSARPMTSWVLDWLRHSRIAAWIAGWMRGPEAPATPPQAPAAAPAAPGGKGWGPALSNAVFLVLLAALGLGAWKLAHLLSGVRLGDWREILDASFWTLGRVLLATALGTLWALPAGLAIGLSPRLSRALQPVVQVAASFPAPMLFPLVIVALRGAGIPLGWGSVLLMLLGTQWYILFNVIAGAMTVPSDLREAARSYRLGRWRRFRTLYVPAVFPYLVTGWVTAAGGAWNASIVSEYVTFGGEVLTARGLGARITRAAGTSDFPLLAASVAVMSAIVVLFNRLVWRQCYRLAQERFSLNK